MVVTIIIPVFNRADLLPSAIASILRQTAVLPLDVLIIDDGSTDETPTIIAEFVARHPDMIRSVRQEKGGVTKARNTGLENLLPETAFVTFLDSDDVMAPGRFDEDLPILLQNPDVEITYGDMIITFAIDRSTLSVPEDAKQMRLTTFHLACSIYRRSLIEKVGMFDETMKQGEDTDYILRTFEMGTNFKQTETICQYYLRHDGNMSARAADNRLWFTRALVRSMQRRKADPSLKLNKPEFNIENAAEFWLS